MQPTTSGQTTGIAPRFAIDRNTGIAPRFAIDRNTGLYVPEDCNWLRQHGLVLNRRTRHTDTTHAKQLSDGTLVPLIPGVSISRTALNSMKAWEYSRALAVAQACMSNSAAVCSMSAALMWNLWCYQPPKQVELILPDGTQPQSKKHWKQHQIFRSRVISEHDILDINGARFTTLSRTIRDIALYHGVLATTLAIDSIRAANPEFTSEALSKRLVQNQRFQGIRCLREAITLSSDRSESPMETIARVAMYKDTKLRNHRIEVQPTVLVDGQALRPDFIIDGWLVLECDGRVKFDGSTFNSSTDEAIRKAHDRSAKLGHKFTVLHLRWEEVIPDRSGNNHFLKVVHRELMRGPRGNR